MRDTENPQARTIIALNAVTKSFGAVQALKGITANIREGEFFSLLGPSGCGKTTLLRMIAGFDEPTTGTIAIDGKPMAGIAANHRPTNMVFQSYAIFPHLSVADNVGYGLKKRRLPKAEYRREVEQALEMVDLGGYGPRAAHTLSGGQRQRVALARALIMKPKVVLLDEPLSALDKKLRDQMQLELRQLQRSVGITFILVTHDQEEALIMSDRIAVMFDGQIEQLATPEDLYRRPVNQRVASFIGVMNFLGAQVSGSDENQVSLDVQALGRIDIPRAGLPEGMKPEDIHRVGVRPEMMTILIDSATTAERIIEGEVVETSYYGDMTYYAVRLIGLEEPVTISMRNTAGRAVLRPGEIARVGFATDSIILFR
ncbi:ABC transporter ATP-binding protein [Ruegeria marina]|uniref:Spermidine/putrescine transport system ATP-binding protein n=1 Tax=Ruegeria marina TaxID=639004 RepID=A0A1G7CUK1_9RHOB|nr:ABC transporter ATP-binding protein [Ruegeria marina]SDE42901.1 spermidine/putrescine transport system ATP-binding protein [Ruegeria marina]